MKPVQNLFIGVSDREKENTPIVLKGLDSTVNFEQGIKQEIVATTEIVERFQLCPATTCSFSAVTFKGKFVVKSDTVESSTGRGINRNIKKLNFGEMCT